MSCNIAGGVATLTAYRKNGLGPLLKRWAA